MALAPAGRPGGRALWAGADVLGGWRIDPIAGGPGETSGRGNIGRADRAAGCRAGETSAGHKKTRRADRRAGFNVRSASPSIGSDIPGNMVAQDRAGR